MIRWLRAHGFLCLVLPLVLYSLVAAFITWPLITRLSTHVIGTDLTDSYEFLRLGWWAKYAIQHGQNPFYQSLFAYPAGYFDAVQWAQPLIYWPIAALGIIFDPIAAFNLWVLIEIVLCGLTAYWLCLEFTSPRPLGSLDRSFTRPVSDPKGDPLSANGEGEPIYNDSALSEHSRSETRISRSSTLAALVGGLVFMAFPTVQGHLSAGHVNILSNYAVPLLVLALYRIVDGRGTTRTASFGAAMFAILLLGNYTAPIFIILPLVLFGGAYLLLTRRKVLLKRKTLRELAIVFGLGLILIAPFYVPVIREALTMSSAVYAPEGGWDTYSTDPLNFIALSPFTSWSAPVAPAFGAGVLKGFATEDAAYLGLTAVLLALVALIRQRRRTALWLMVALGCIVFSLGPLLKWNEQLVPYNLPPYITSVVMPWALFQKLPLISITRTPGRFNFMTALCLAILASVGLHEILLLVKRSTLRIAIAGLVVVLVVAEYQLFFPFPTIPAQLPAYFAALATRDDIHGAVFDVPWDYDVGQKEALFEQTAHHQPLLAGYIARRTPVDPAKLTMLSNAALGLANNLESRPLDPNAARALMRENGVSVIVYHWAAIDRTYSQDWASLAFHAPAYQDDHISIYEVPKAEGQPDTTAYTFSGGWWKHTSNDVPWLEGSASLRVYAPKTEDRQWTLKLAPLLQARRLQLSVDGKLFRTWTVNMPLQQIDFWLQLEQGFHTLQFTLPDGCTFVALHSICLLDKSAGLSAGRDMTDASCHLDNENICVGMALSGLQSSQAGNMAYQSHLVYLANGLKLLGYRAPATVQPGQTLSVETTWQATQKLPGDYHLFVHLYDATGQLVTQYDSVPDSGNFPAAKWAENQLWSELATLKLPVDLPPGTYQLYAGWYRYPDLTRLGVEGTASKAADGLVYLTDILVR